MREFKTYHPIVNFLYFVCVIGFSMFFLHPVCLATSLLCALTHMTLINGVKVIKTAVVYMLPMAAVAAVINVAFNHEGATILAYFPGGNPLTLESVTYGLAAAAMLMGVICWFLYYNEIMTSDKFIYLFGKVIPSLSLILSMTLRFVPRFTAQLKIVADAQKCSGCKTQSVMDRAKRGLSVFSAMITWAMENSVETADSMKARGYGLPGRSAFSIFTFGNRDRTALLWIIFLGIYILAGGIFGRMNFQYFPSMRGAEFSLRNISVFAAYFALCATPAAIELWEGIKWKALKSKI